MKTADQLRQENDELFARINAQFDDVMEQMDSLLAEMNGSIRVDSLRRANPRASA